jgi:signal transduction histidine kinase
VSAAWDRLVTRVRALPARRQDALAAALVTAIGVLDVGYAVRDAPGATVALGFAALAAVAASFAVRRSHPILAVALGFGTMAALGRNGYLDDSNVPYIALLVIPYSLARHTDGLRFVAGMALIAVLLVVGMLTDVWEDTFADFALTLVLLLGAPGIAGRLLRNRAALARALAEKTERLQREREALAARAVEDERTRIAGELHDVVSHALGAMVVGAGGARLMAGRDPEKAAQAFSIVEETGREALTELRRLLGVLRRGDEELALAPQPSLANLGDLVRRTSRAGLPVELQTSGQAPGALPAGVDLTAYRLVQAALGAARDGGGAGRAEVRVRFEPGRVHVSVRDDGRADDARELVGMRERVTFYGGELHAGLAGDGRHAVRATLPLEVPA